MYERIKDDILGKKYSLSIAFVSPRKSREVNKKYRKKDKPTNVLSFAYAKNEGEILLCKNVIVKEAKLWAMTYKQFLNFLVIHGMLHLKGMKHSSRMDRAQNFYHEKYFNRNRRGHHDDKSGGSRTSKRRKKS